MQDIVIAAAQSVSVRGALEANIAEHLEMIRVAATAGAALVVFPELSLTGYELDLASSLSLHKDAPRLAPLRRAARQYGLHALIGAPLASGRDRPFLGAFLLSPGRSAGYAKIHVHESEAPYFTAGEEHLVSEIAGLRTGVAICADTSHPAHANRCAELGARLYAASVMKTQDEYPSHAERLRGYAARHGMATLTANYAGSSGGAISAGKSAIWDERGELVVRAPSNDRALVIARRTGGEWTGEVIELPRSASEA